MDTTTEETTVELTKRTRKSELRCHLTPETHNYIREQGQEIGLGSFIEVLVKSYQSIHTLPDRVEDICRLFKI